MDIFFQLLTTSLLLGGIYALMSVGLTLIFGVMRVVNFAHGEFIMLGMYLAFWGFTLYHLDPYVILLFSIPLFLAIGFLLYGMVMRGIIAASHNVQIFTTVGLSIALQNLALVLWTGDFRFVRLDYSKTVFRFWRSYVNLPQLIAFAIAAVLMLTLFALLRWTHFGKVVRATAQDREAAILMGIDPDRIHRLTFAMGITCAGVAGVLVSPLYSVYPTAGLQFVLIAYVVVVLGGLGNMIGALLGSLIVAGVEVMGSFLLGTAWKEVLYFLVFLLVLIFRPAGLLGQRGAETLGA